MRRISPLALAILATQFLCAQSPDAQTILSRAYQSLTDLKSYRIEASTLIETSGQDFEQTIKSKVLIAAEPPLKFRVETKGNAPMVIVSDGANTWNYNAYLKQFTKTAPQPLGTSVTTGPASWLSAGGTGQTVRSARIIGEETLTIQGTPHKCYVVETDYHNKMGNSAPTVKPSKLWVDQTTFLVLKHINQVHMNQSIGPLDMTTTTIVESLDVGKSLPPDMFVFVAPDGARQVEKIDYFPSVKTSAVVSKAAPDFHLSDLDGKEYKLSDLRGKTVLLDFWATWCGPCRAEMPVIEQIHKEHPEIVVLGIDVGEELETVRNFVSENNVTYPTLLAGRDRIADDYDAHALPTVVIIDPAGIVRSHQVGYGTATEQQLRTAISAAAKPQAPAPTETIPAGVFRVGGGVTPPSVTFKVDPEYSEEARKTHLSGTVLLSLVVGVDGVARNMKVVRSLGSGLDEKAIEAVSKWKFNPGRKSGDPVPVQATIEVNFRLLDGPPGGSTPAAPEPTPATAAEAYRRATRLIRTQRVPEGIALLDKAIALDPSWGEAFAARASAQIQQRRYSEAIDDYSEALRLNPKNAAWYDGRGLAYASSGRPSRAIEDYNRAIDLTPNAPVNYYTNRGFARLQAGDAAKSIEDMTAAIEKSPSSTGAFQGRADAYVKLKDWPRAIADYTAVIELNPTKFTYERRADARKNNGDTAGADQDLKKASEFGVPAPVRVPGTSIQVSPGDSIDASLPAPKLISPKEGEVFDTYPRHVSAAWEPTPGAASYLLEWDYFYNNVWNTEFKHLPVGGLTYTAPAGEFDFVGAQPGRWRVWPVNRNGQRGNASEWRTFRFTR